MIMIVGPVPDAPPMMPMAPTMDAQIPMVIARLGASRANASPMTVDAAGATNPHNPLSRPLFRPKTPRIMLGASAPERPESIQIAQIAGTAAANSLRAGGGTATRGISERIAPGARVTVSGDSTTTTMPSIVMMMRTMKTTAFAMSVS